jgi:hypothetical protein
VVREMTGTERVQLPVRLPSGDYEALKGYAHFCNQSMNDIVVRAVHEFLSGEARQAQMKAMLDSVRTEYRTTLEKLKDL